ncbi:MAG TPA: hypothetical protein VGV69_09655 [Solirubrobacterales bacterium]|nr:hypothetical protein [Solirubrobacterales bacterium]
MRKLPLLSALLLLSLLLASVSAQAASLPGLAEPAFLTAVTEEEEPEAEEEPEEDDGPEAEEDEACEPDEEELCEEAGEETGQGKGKRKDDECLLQKASATVTANPGKRRLRLTVHYRTLKPATVDVEALLRSAKGVVYLGTDHARFRRSGVYRDTYQLAEKQMKKAVAAREFEVELHAVGTPPSCQVELSAHRDGAKKLLWS